MKAISIAKRFTSVLALLLAIMMIFAACGGDETTSNASDNADQSDISSVESDVESQPEDTGDETESNQTNTSKQTQQTNPSKQPGTTGKYDAFNNDQDANFIKNAPKGEVHVLMWRTFHKSEQLLVDQYQKLTGNKVKVTVTTESEYPTKLVSMVSGGNSPDVICFSAGNFPGLVTKALQPLQNKYFQLDSDCWNKNYMDAYKINGVYFGVAQPKSWSCEDCTYVTYYSPQILKNCGITTTPYQLYKDGKGNKWNWEKQKEIALAVKNKGFNGLSVQSMDMFMLSAGVDFAKYDGSKYTNQLGKVKGTDLLTKAWQEAAELKQKEALTGWDLTNVQQGKVGLFTAISYGLYNEGNWFQSSFAKGLEAVPVAGPTSTTYTPVRPKCWGVPKKAKNPEGAAYFLRYFLDTSAFNFSSTFHNKQFEEVYNIITSSSAKKTVMHGWGVSDYVESGTYSKICNALVATSPANINQQLNSKKGSVQTGIARANKDLARIKK
ncbi:MAG: extracellular solute-binding protein [Ruminococcaceae bacterium]|nr:extracellular solute-binding protein [Oscillospiraceae bacterium]